MTVLKVVPSKVTKLLRSRQLGCTYVGSTRRITETHLAEYIKLAASLRANAVQGL